ncbi:MAG TPA: vWA domain-containing protein [Verrucomicrobiae bacterium]|nr:vWA domain-containing protein [Verrucomicrobiae bacterium]
MSGCRRVLAPVVFLALAFSAVSTGRAQNLFAIQSIQPTTNGGIAIKWSTLPGAPNRVRYTDSLDQPWRDLWGAGFLPAVSQTNFSYTDSTASNVAQRFYRIRAGRNQVILSLVLDRSGSMAPMNLGGNGGLDVLKETVPVFLNYFDDALDRASMVSFSSTAIVDFPMGRPFNEAIATAVDALTADGWTASEQGLLKGWQQNESVVLPPDQPVVKAMVFFTDGLANTWQPGDLFTCGGIMRTNNIGPDLSLWNPATGAMIGGCTFPPCLHSITNQNACVSTARNCDEGGQHNNVASAMYDEAEARAEYWAEQARLQGIVIYSIGLGDPNGPPECGRPPLNPEFLKAVANDPSSANFNANQPAGVAIIVTNARDIQAALDLIAADILSRAP